MRLTRLVTVAAAAVAMCGFSAAHAAASIYLPPSALVVLIDPCDGNTITGGLASPKLLSLPEEIEMSGLIFQGLSGGLVTTHWQGTGADGEGIGHYQGIFNGAAPFQAQGLTVPFAGLIHNQIEGETIAFKGSVYVDTYTGSLKPLTSLPQLILVTNAICVDQPSNPPFPHTGL